MPKTIEIKEARTQYTLPLDEAQLAEGPLIVERQGEPIAAIISFAEYERYRAWQEEQRRHNARLAPFERERASLTWQEAQKRLLQKEIDAFERLKPELLNTHKGKQVAILNGRVVDSDDDKRALAKRVYAKYGYRPVLMTEVRLQPRAVRVESPQVKRR